LKRRDGALVPVEIVARMLEDGRIQVIARDIGERERAEAALRASEARFRALFDADVMPICFWRADGQVTAANDALLALTGFDRDELAAGLLRWDELTAPEHRDRDQRAFAEVMERGACTPYEKDLVLRDGRRVAVLNGGTMLPGHVDGGVAFVIDLTERKRAEELLHELTSQLLRTQDEERRRIARELHDVTAQDLFAQSLLLARLAAGVVGLDAAARADLAEARALGERALGELRTQSYLLHPPLLDELGLATALEWLVDGFAQRSGIAVELAADAAVGRLPAAVELTLYRVAQEGLGNVYRHAGSATARVTLARDRDTATLRVEDRGRGLAGAPEGVGIAGMRERLVPLGGHLALASSERGTVITATVPIPPDAAP
jgi:PAS domain S-box-containing protein